MKELPDIKQLDTEAKDALIVVLWEEVQKLRKLVKKPKKTSKNSSLPPAKGVLVTPSAPILQRH